MPPLQQKRPQRQQQRPNFGSVPNNPGSMKLFRCCANPHDVIMFSVAPLAVSTAHQISFKVDKYEDFLTNEVKFGLSFVNPVALVKRATATNSGVSQLLNSDGNSIRFKQLSWPRGALVVQLTVDFPAGVATISSPFITAASQERLPNFGLRAVYLVIKIPLKGSAITPVDALNTPAPVRVWDLQRVVSLPDAGVQFDQPLPPDGPGPGPSATGPSANGLCTTSRKSHASGAGVGRGSRRLGSGSRENSDSELARPGGCNGAPPDLDRTGSSSSSRSVTPPTAPPSLPPAPPPPIFDRSPGCDPEADVCERLSVCLCCDQRSSMFCRHCSSGLCVLCYTQCLDADTAYHNTFRCPHCRQPANGAIQVHTFMETSPRVFACLCRRACAFCHGNEISAMGIGCGHAISCADCVTKAASCFRDGEQPAKCPVRSCQKQATVLVPLKLSTNADVDGMQMLNR